MSNATEIASAPMRRGPDFYFTDPVEFAHRHKITVAVARAILFNSRTTEQADAAVFKMRG